MNPQPLTSNALKAIAIAAMAIDHIAYAFVPEESAPGVIMHLIGRITGPVMFYAAVEGYHHTKNLPKYLLRLAAFALISWFPFLYFKRGGAISDMGMIFFPNVIYTILLGVLAIHIRRKLKNTVLKTVLILSLIVLCIPADWGTWGIIIIIAFDYFHGNFKNQAFAYWMIVLLDMGVLSTLTHPFFGLFYEGTFAPSLEAWQITEFGLFLPIMLLSLYNGQKGGGGKHTKWVFYVFYPLHLLAIGFIQSLI